jgi:hypothetical protein
MTHPARLDAEVVAHLFDLPALVGWNSAVVLYELRLSTVDDGWRAVLKARGTGGYKVAFVYASSYGRLLEALSAAVAAGEIRWTTDRYPPRTS